MLAAQPGEATGAFFTDGACTGGAISHVVIPPGEGTATFRFRGTHAGTTSLSATAAGRTVSATLTVTPGAAAQLAFLGGPLALRTSELCSSERSAVLRFEVEDEFGNRTTTPTAVACSPAVAGNLSLTFFDAASGQCAAPVAGVTIGPGSSEAGFLLRANAVGSGTVTITPQTGLRAATQTLTVAAGDATRLAFATGPQTPLAGECTPAETVLEAQDALGTPSSFAVDTTVSLATTTVPLDATFHFYGQAGCPQASVRTTLLFPAGQSRVRLYFRGEKQTTSFGIQASPSAGAVVSLGGNSVRAGPPATLTWAPPAPPRAQAGACSASYALKLVDAFLNPTVFPSAQALQVVSTPGGLTFDTAPGQCQSAGSLSFPPGTSEVAVQARGIDAGTYQVSATTAGVSTAGPTSLQVVAGPTASLVFVGLPSGLDAGTCSGGVTLLRKDAFQNPSSDGPFDVSLSGSSLLVATGPNCFGATSNATVTFGSTASTSGVFSVTGTTVGPASVTASARAGALGATGLVDISAAGPHHLVFTTVPAGLDAGTCSGPLSLELRDAYGNPASATSPLSVALKDTPDGGATFFTDQGCTSTSVTGLVMSGSTTSFSFLPTSPGALSVSAKGQGLDGGSPTQAWTVGP